MVFSLVVFAFLSVSNLVRTNILATEGAVVSEIEATTLKLEKENRTLSVKISERSRLAELEAYATNLGFVRTNNMVFVPNTNTFALR